MRAAGVGLAWIRGQAPPRGRSRRSGDVARRSQAALPQRPEAGAPRPFLARPDLLRGPTRTGPLPALCARPAELLSGACFLAWPMVWSKTFLPARST